MEIRQVHNWLYSANATVLIAHQIDAAYWHEWELFGMPGGIQLFVILNLPIVFLVLYGQRVLALESKSSIVISCLLVASGLFAVGIHSFFLMQGDDAFRLPVSLGLLIGTLFLSPAQAIVVIMLITAQH
jgi:hypothetical protein